MMQDTPRDSKLLPVDVEAISIPARCINLQKLVGCVIVLCLSPFYFGYCLTYLSTFSTTTLTTVFTQKAADSVMNSVLIGILTIGAAVGAFTAPFLMKITTRKQFLLVINAIALIIEGVIQVPNLYVLLVCRFIQGICIGNFMSIVPIYINQLSPKDVVGSFGVFTQLFVVIALVVSYGLGLILTAAGVVDFTFYRIMVGMNIITIGIQVACLLTFIPQSPNSLIEKNRIDQAKEVIAMFNAPEFVDAVLKEKTLEVESESEKQQESVLRSDSQSSSTSKQPEPIIKYSRRAYILGFQLPFMQQLTGINGVVTSAKTIVASTSSQTIANLTPLIINIVQLCATISTVFILSKIGRKPLTIFGNLGLGISDIFLGIFFVLTSIWGPASDLILVMLIVYMIIYGVSLGPVVWLYVPQIIPAKIVPFATMMNWIGCSLCVIFMPIITNLNGGNAYPIFFFFGALTLGFCVLNSLWMVQTKGKSAEKIAKQLTDKQN